MKGLVVAVCLVALAGVALAQAEFNGKWTGEIAAARGPATPVTLTFKAEGAKLTGTLGALAAPAARGARGGRGRGRGNAAPEVPITDGVISGGAIRFKTTREVRGIEETHHWTGRLTGDELVFSRVRTSKEGALFPEAPQEFTLKRAP